jgi:hypothetical protein
MEEDHMRTHRQSEQAKQRRTPIGRGEEEGRAKGKDRKYHGTEYEYQGKKKRA